MFPLQQLQQERTHKALSMNDLVAGAEKQNRPMTADETALFDRLAGEVENLDTQIKERQEHAARAERMAQLQARLAAPAGRQTQPDAPASPAPQNGPGRVPATASRTGALKAFKGPDARERAYRVGMWALANVFGNEKAARYCEVHGIGTGVGGVRAAMGTNVNTAGGALVPEEFSDALIDLREEYGQFRQNAFVWPMSRDTTVIPRRTGGLKVVPVGENSLIPPTQPTIDNVRLTARKIGGIVYLSNELDEDAVIDLGNYLVDEFALAFATFEDGAGFNGDGSSDYLGVKGLAWWFTPTNGALAGQVAAAAGHDTFAELDAGDFARMIAALPVYARRNAKWYVSGTGMSLSFGRLLAAAGGNTAADLANGYMPKWMGFPVVEVPTLPVDSGSLAGKPMLYLGDLSRAAVLGDRREVKVFESEHTRAEYDQVIVRGTERIDIVVHGVGDATKPGPIVALVGTA